MDFLLWRAIKRIRPRDGWVVLVLIWTALLSVPLGIQEARWVPRGESGPLFISVTVAGGVLSVLLAWTRLPGWIAGAVSGLGGMAFVVNTVGRVLPPWPQSLAELAYLRQWLRQGWSDGIWAEIPFRSLLADSSVRLSLLVQRLAEWWSVVRGGGVSQDNVPFLLLVGLALWTATVLAVWGIYRWRRPLVAFLPGGAMLAISLYHSGEGLFQLLLFLAVATFLVPWMRFEALVWSWERRGVDYSPEVRFDVALLGLALAGAVILGGFVMPSVSIPQLARWVWDHSPDAWKSNDEGVWRAFGGVRRPRHEGGIGIPVGLAGLPRAHLLGGSVDLTRQPVMAVTTDDPPRLKRDASYPDDLYEVPQYYWRALTYDQYTGRGWTNERLERERYEVGQRLPRMADEGHRELRQEFSLFASDDGAIYAAGDPLWLNVSFIARWRAPDDLAGMEKEDRLLRYTVLSVVPDMEEGALREAPADYPVEISERYLQLPDDVPQRVLDLAHDVTVDAPTPYDKALALQTYLRQFNYSLNIDAPPLGQDVVDHFLFDVQIGYCDYYASAMVVMARAVGLPARLAIGYASGTFDPARGHYYVVEADAHSWSEIYFPGHGWIEFEPTAALRPFEREGAGPLPDLPPLPPPPRSPAGKRVSVVDVLRDLRVFLAVLVLWLIWDRWPRLSSLPGPALMAAIYRRLGRHGARFGVPMQPGDTPSEYGSRLAQSVAQRAEQPRWRRGTLAPQARSAISRLATLEGLYLRAVYSRHPLDEHERRVALDFWRRLSSWLWLIWLGGRATGKAGR